MKKNSSCLSCKLSSFEKIILIKKFPAYFGAVPTLNDLNRIPFYPLSISRCKNCGLVQQINLINENVMNKVYEADYYNIASPILTGMGKTVIDEFYNFLLSSNKKKGKVLELASSDGYLLLRLKKAGYDVYGCDPGSLSNIAAKNLGKERIKNTFFDSQTYEKESFDFIIFRNLLEHIYKPDAFLSSVHKTLKKNGKIFIEVPDIKYYEKYGGFGSFFHQHVFYFSLQTLSKLLNDNRFKILKYQIRKEKIFVMAEIMQEKNKPQFFGGIYDTKKIVRENMNLTKKIIKIFRNKSNKKIALFGASSVSTAIAQILNASERKKISHVFDNDVSKHGLFCVGVNKKILAPLRKYTSEFDFIIVTSYVADKIIRKQLLELKVKKDKIISLLP